MAEEAVTLSVKTAGLQSTTLQAAVPHSPHQMVIDVSGTSIYGNGLTAEQEKTAAKDACREHLARKGIQLDQSEALRELLGP